MGRVEGHERRDGGLRRARRRSHATRISSSPGRRRAASPTTPRRTQVLQRVPRAVDEAPGEGADAVSHLVCVPMDDPDENAVIVNALQRHAAVVVQKSLAEGFGLTVAEAMWKSRPVVGCRGRRHRRPDRRRRDRRAARRPPRPRDLRPNRGCAPRRRKASASAWGTTVIGARCEQFLGDRHLEQWAQLFARLDGQS